MPKYRISYTTEDWWTLDVEAANMDEAMENFHLGGWTHQDAVLSQGGYLQDSVEIFPLKETS